jgi:uncharacterized protein (TIGR04141 family)
MNAIPPGQVVELQARQVFAAFHRLRERAPGATGHRNFGVEGDRDLVAAIEGIAQQPTSLGARVRGATGLSIEVVPAQLAKALAEALQLHTQPARFADWSEFDNLTPVQDDDEIKGLESLLEEFLARRPKDLVLAAPGDEEMPAATLFHVGRLTKSPVLRPLLYPSAFYDAVDQKPTIAAARSTPVHLYDPDRSKLEVRTNILECICFETMRHGRSFVLCSGRWYEANGDFVARVRARISALSAPKKRLPRWDGIQDEATYNVGAGKKGTGIVTLDRKLVRIGGGKSALEHCDLFHAASRTLYFVKQYSGSSTMSHLVEQTRRTAELFFAADGAYRKKMAKAGLKAPKARPQQRDWTLCLVVMGRELAKLPLFAQCAIARLTRDLERNQHSVAAQAV